MYIRAYIRLPNAVMRDGRVIAPFRSKSLYIAISYAWEYYPIIVGGYRARSENPILQRETKCAVHPVWGGRGRNGAIDAHENSQFATNRSNRTRTNFLQNSGHQMKRTASPPIAEFTANLLASTWNYQLRQNSLLTYNTNFVTRILRGPFATLSGGLSSAEFRSRSRSAVEGIRSLSDASTLTKRGPNTRTHVRAMRTISLYRMCILMYKKGRVCPPYPFGSSRGEEMGTGTERGPPQNTQPAHVH